MNQFISKKLSAIWLILFALAVTGCASLIDKYDKVAYENATSLKVDSLALMDKATGAYADNKQAVNGLVIKIDKAYEYANGRPKNDIVTKQWLIMKDPERKLLGGFLKRWEEKEELSKVFVTEAKKNISLGFDQIIGLESGKIKPEGSE